MSVCMAWDSVPLQGLTCPHWNWEMLFYRHPLTHYHRDRLPPIPGVSSKGPCTSGSQRPSKLSPISIHSPKL